jgi:hypothetical protein
MGSWHVLGQSCVLAFEPTARVCGDTLAAVQDLDAVAGDACIHFLTNQAVRHAVIVVVDLDVVINVDAALLERGDLVPARRQCTQRRSVEPFEPFPAIALELPERALVQIGDELADRSVQFGKTEEAVIAQPGENSALDDLYADFGLGLLASQQLSVMRNVA